MELEWLTDEAREVGEGELVSGPRVDEDDVAGGPASQPLPQLEDAHAPLLSALRPATRTPGLLREDGDLGLGGVAGWAAAEGLVVAELADGGLLAADGAVPLPPPKRYLSRLPVQAVQEKEGPRIRACPRSTTRLLIDVFN